MALCIPLCAQVGNCPVTIISAGAYSPPPGYSTTEPAPPAYNLPAFNKSCILEPPVPRPTSRWIKYDDIVINKSVEQNFQTCKTYVIENNVHHQHNKIIVTTVNRNHLHVQRIITKENHFHHFNTEYIVKVNDIHTQRVEQLKAEGITSNDYRQTSRVEAATCQVTAEPRRMANDYFESQMQDLKQDCNRCLTPIDELNAIPQPIAAQVIETSSNFDY